MQFDLAGKADIRAISITRAGGDEGEVIAVLGLTFDGQPAAPVAAAIGAESVDELAFFHADNVDRDRRFLRMESIAIATTYTGKHKLTIAGFDVRPKKVSKITATPVGLGQWSVNVSAQVTNPPPRMLEVLAEMLHAEVRAELSMDPELPLEGGGRGDASQAMSAIDALCREDGVTAELLDADGNTLAKFGGTLYEPQQGDSANA